MLDIKSLICVPVFLALAAFSFAAQADHSWNGYHWARTTTHFTLPVVDSVTTDWDGQLGESLARWSLSSVLAANVTSASDSTKTRKQCRMVQGQMRVCNAAYGFNGWLGLATIGLDPNGHIDRGTAKVNDSYSSYWTYEEKNHVMCQEIGHTFGLAHQDENFNNANLGTCMDYTSDPDGPPSNENPNQHDYDQLASIYKHKDRFTSVGAAPAGTAPAGWANADVHAQENWGELIGVSANGQESLYMRDFGNGYKIFTFVIWAQE